jgi:hypothetical protein
VTCAETRGMREARRREKRRIDICDEYRDEFAIGDV